MKLLFAGTPDVAVPSLRALHAAGHDILAVVTRADAPLGRKRVLTPSPVAAAADELGLRVIKANRLDAAVSHELIALGADLGVVVAYGGLVCEPLLSAPPHGWINLHFSLLPRWRGASPVQAAIAAGDDSTGAAVFRLVPELDAGDVFDSIECPIGARDTAASLLGALSIDGAELLTRVVAAIDDDSARARPQVGEPSYAPKLGIDDARIDWARPVAVVDARIRAVTPEPGAFTVIGDQRLKVLDAVPAPDADALAPGVIVGDRRRVLAGTADRPLELIRVQPAGKAPMAALDWWRGVSADEMRAS